MGRKQIAVVAAVAVAVVIGVLALASGGEDATTVRPDALADAAERTASVKGMRYDLTGEMNLPGAGEVSFDGTGVSDIKGERTTAKMDMSEFAQHAPSENGLNDPDKWQMEVLADGRFMYMKFPLLEPELDGKSWMKMDLLKVSKAAGVDPSLIRAEQQQGTDPASTLRYLRAVSDDVEQVGTEEVRGVKTTHYRATIDLHKYPNLLPKDQRDQARRSVDQLIKLTGDDQMNTEVWVGEDKLIHRMKWDQSMKPVGSQQVLEATYTTEFYDFDAQVKIDPPPESDTKDVTDEVATELARQR